MLHQKQYFFERTGQMRIAEITALGLTDASDYFKLKAGLSFGEAASWPVGVVLKWRGSYKKTRK